MKHLYNMIFLPPGTEERYQTAHRVWLGLCLTGLGCCIGLLTLLLGATACVKLPGGALFVSYLKHPLLLFLNLLFPVALVWLFIMPPASLASSRSAPSRGSPRSWTLK